MLPVWLLDCTHKQKVFCNCLYLKMCWLVACLYVDVFHKCNKENLTCCCPVCLYSFFCFVFYAVLIKCLWSVWRWSTHFKRPMNQRCMLWCPGAYILLNWIESFMLILSGGENCHIKSPSFTYTAVCWILFTNLLILIFARIFDSRLAIRVWHVARIDVFSKYLITNSC